MSDGDTQKRKRNEEKPSEIETIRKDPRFQMVVPLIVRSIQGWKDLMVEESKWTEFIRTIVVKLDSELKTQEDIESMIEFYSNYLRVLVEEFLFKQTLDFIQTNEK